jgi:hypothetical protein
MVRDLMEQFNTAVIKMERKNTEYDEIHLSKEDCEYILNLIEEDVKKEEWYKKQ